MACIFLAAKIEESPRRIREVINVFHHIKQAREGRYVHCFVCYLCNRKYTPVMFDQAYANLKNHIIKAERRVLKELGFCVHGKHPHKVSNTTFCDSHLLVDHHVRQISVACG